LLHRSLQNNRASTECVGEANNITMQRHVAAAKQSGFYRVRWRSQQYHDATSGCRWLRWTTILCQTTDERRSQTLFSERNYIDTVCWQQLNLMFFLSISILSHSPSLSCFFLLLICPLRLLSAFSMLASALPHPSVYLTRLPHPAMSYLFQTRSWCRLAEGRFDQTLVQCSLAEGWFDHPSSVLLRIRNCRSACREVG
jgi:hypothetical protein